MPQTFASKKLVAAHLYVLPGGDPVPIATFNIGEQEAFLGISETLLFPEMGSRAFSNPEALSLNSWTVVQKQRYEYLVTQPSGTPV